MESLTNAILNIGVAVVIVMVVAYFVYMFGLILVLRRMDRLTWHAFVPFINYYSLLLAINAPKKWFGLAQIPYAGSVYVGSGAVKLGRTFHRGPAFSLTWLTIGAPVGMLVLARSKKPIDQKVMAERAHLLEIKAIRKNPPHKSKPSDSSAKKG